MKRAITHLFKGVVLLVVSCGTVLVARATDYTWTGGNGDWSNPAQWTGGGSYPQVGDTATFSAASAVWLNIASGAQAVDRVNVTGSGEWTWDGANTLTVGSGGFNYGSTGTGKFWVNASLAGTGALTITAGRLNLGWTATVNTFSGGLIVRNGIAGFAVSTALGAAPSSITLGGKGTFGTLLKTGGAEDLTVVNPLVLDGAGGKLSSPQWKTIVATNTVSGPCRLVLSASRAIKLSPAVNSTFTGGTSIQVSDPMGVMVTTTNRAFGTGNVVIESGNNLYLFGSNNVAPTASVTIRSALMVHGLMHLDSDFAVPAIDTNSAGGIVFIGNSGANINARFAVGAPQLGNGRITLGGGNSPAYFTGTSLQPNTDGVYRILARNSLGFANGVFTGTNAVEVYGNYIDFGSNPNNFTGTLTLLRGSQLVGYCMPTPGTSPFGAPSGSIVLNRASPARGLTINAGGGGYTNPVLKASLTYNSSSLLELYGVTYPASIEVGTLTRGDHATLKINGNGNLGGAARFTATAGVPASVNDMVAPHIAVSTGFYDANLFFADYKNGSFTAATHTVTSLAGAGNNSLVNLAAGEAVPGGGKTVYALKTAYAVTGTSADTLTIGSGGLILAGSTITHTAPLNFGSAEGVLWTIANNTWNGKISGSGGLIKAGGGGSGTASLTLGASNDFTGVVSINEGALTISNDNNLGHPGNAIYLNNGGLFMLAGGNTIALVASAAIVSSREVILGSNSGGFGGEGWTLNGKITGIGTLFFTGNTTKYVNNATNDYTGGTYIEGGTVEVGATGKLGLGDVVLSPYNSPGTLRLKGVDNVHSNAQVTLRLDPVGSAAKAELQASSSTFGSLEGNVPIILGTASQATTLKVGGNNGSTEFYGDISEVSASYPGALVKEGSGTFTYWGVNSCSGTTTVNKGTMIVNGTQGRTEVGGSGRLSGSGLIANNVQIKAGGTLAPGYLGQGILQVNGTVDFDANSTYEVALRGPNAAVDFAQLSVSGTLNLGGVLNLALSFAPTIGQQFTIMDNPAGTTVNGTFAPVSVTYGGKNYNFRVQTNGGDGNDVVLTTVPRGTVVFIQ